MRLKIRSWCEKMKNRPADIFRSYQKRSLQQYRMLDESGLLLYHYEENSIDNIDVFEDHVVGTFVVPMKGSVLESKVSVGFYVTESRILLFR